MQKQIMSITANFNLREPRSDKPTTLYLVVKMGGKQYRFSTGVKVFPRQWDRQKQIAIVSNTQSKLDNYNNRVANEKLLEYKQLFSNFLSYLCTVGPSPTYNVLRSFIYTEEVMPRKKTATFDAINIIRSAFEMLYENKKGTSTYKEYSSRLSSFISYINDNGLIDNKECLSQYGIEDYQDYLLNKNKESIGNVNKKCAFIQTLVNKCLCKKRQFRDYGFTIINIDKIKDTRSENDMGRFPLTVDEISMIQSYQLTEDKYSLMDVAPLGKNGKVNNKYRSYLSKKQLDEFRDIFIFQCSCGQRVSDIKQILKNEYKEFEKNGKKYLEIKTKKSKYRTSAYVEVSDVVVRFFEKYTSGFANNIEIIDTSNSFYNISIKKICYLCGIDRIIDYIDAHGIKHSEPAYMVITNHDARHTFITNMVKKDFKPDVLCELTGHTSDNTIKHIYTHLTSSDRIDKIIVEQNRIANVQEEKHAETPMSDLIEDAKHALAYLGAEAVDFVDVDDFDQLQRLIYQKYELDILREYNVNVDTLKSLYHAKNKSIKEKREMLKKLLKEIDDNRNE